MAAYRKLVRDAVKAVMSDLTYGFNAKFAAVKGTYGITDSVSLDWSDDSTSVFFGDMDSVSTKLAGHLTLSISTRSRWTGKTRGVKWSGQVDAVLMFQVLYAAQQPDVDSGEVDDSMAEPWSEALEDAVVEVFSRPNIPWGATYSVVYVRPPDCPSPIPLETLEDGWRLTVPVEIGFEVDVN